MFTMKGQLAKEMSNYLLNDYRLSMNMKKFNGKLFKCYCNETDEVIGVGCVHIGFIIKPGAYIKIM